MKRDFMFFITLLIFLLTTSPQVDQRREGSTQTFISYEVQSEMNSSRMKMYRGINIGNALEAPNEGDWGVVIKDEYFKIIKEAGFDTVRIPIRWSNHAGSTPPYKIDENFLKRVDHVINESLKQGLITIIDMHHYEEIMQNPKEQKDRFLALWKQISEHYKDYPDTLYFELLNEPHGNLTSDIWNELLKEAVNIIRRTNPTRKIIVGPADWNSVYKLKDLSIPEGDKNIVVTFHFYTPFEFTHQGAEWVNPSPPVGKKWIGNEAEQKQITDELDIAVRWANEHNNVSLFMGEFGAYSKADIESRIRWTYFVAREAEKRGIAWAYWEFCSGFGAYDPVKNEWRRDLLNALIPPPNKYYVSGVTEHSSILGSGWYDKGSYATIKVSETRLGLIVQDVFDHFEGLGPRDMVTDIGTVRVYVDGTRTLVAVWRKDYTRVLLAIVGICIVMIIAVLFYRVQKFSKNLYF